MSSSSTSNSESHGRRDVAAAGNPGGAGTPAAAGDLEDAGSARPPTPATRSEVVEQGPWSDLTEDVWDALASLLSCWGNWEASKHWYLRELVPRIVAVGPAAGETPQEKAAIAALRPMLDDEQWSALGLLLARTPDWLRARQARRSAAVEDLLRQRRADQARIREERARLARERQAQQARVLAEQEAAQLRLAEQARADSARQREAEESRLRRRASLLSELRSQFVEDFLGVTQWLGRHPDRDALTDADLDQEAAVFVTEWCETNLRVPGRVPTADETPNFTPWSPDPAQARVVAHRDTHALVAARAGSGKTATMVARAAFLIRHCGVAPESILMLAFNRMAATQMSERVAGLLPCDRPPHVMTFHALARRIVHPVEELLYDGNEDSRPLSRHVQGVIDRIRSSPQYGPMFRSVMLSYFRTEWTRLTEAGLHLPPEALLAYRRGLRREALAGHPVRSHGEQRIANVLFENDIGKTVNAAGYRYKYEPAFHWSGNLYHPDFAIYRGKNPVVVIEYFGMAGDPGYDDQTARKRKLWAARPDDIAFLEVQRHHVIQPDFDKWLLDHLSEHGVRHQQLSEDEIWLRVQDRAIDRFTETCTNVVSRARQRRWNGADLKAAWNTTTTADSALEDFITLAAAVVDNYHQSLTAAGAEDFTGLMWRAVDKVANGTTRFRRRAGVGEGDLSAVRHVLIDEFQDFSLTFATLIDRILAHSPEARVMAVGDDWQAINEYAGSTLSYFTNFQSHYAPASRLRLNTNRRSTAQLVEVGNALMHELGPPAVPVRLDCGSVQQYDLDKFIPTAIETERFGGQGTQTPALLRVIARHLADGRTIAVLSRRRRMHVTGLGRRPIRDIEVYGEAIAELLDDRRKLVEFTSVHSFKGREAQAVVLMDALEGSYPLIHPTWPLFQVFGDNPETLTDAERRLFYVALSRPESHLAIFTRGSAPSPFLGILTTRIPIEMADLNLLPVPVWKGQQQTVEIRVYGSRLIKDDLKRLGYSYQGLGRRYWYKLVPAHDFTPARLRSRPWAHHPGIQIEVLDASGRVIDSYPETREDVTELT